MSHKILVKYLYLTRKSKWQPPQVDPCLEVFLSQVENELFELPKAPYACLFIDEIETAFLEIQELQPLVWLRYIDDIFFIWTRGEQELQTFCVVLMSSILTSNLLLSQAKKAFYFLILKLVLKTVRLLQICM